MALVNDWNKALYETIKEFPELRKNQYFTGSSQVQVKKLYDLQVEKLTQKFIAMGLDPEEVARRAKKYKPRLKKVSGFAQSMADASIGGIAFNEAYEKSAAEIMRDVADSGYWAKVSGSMKYVVDHELGHQLDNLLLIRENKDIKRLFRKLKKEKLLKTEVSIYAEENATNIKEFIAESWAEYRNSPIPRESAKKVGDLIVKQYGDRFR